jgi:hypothetical protein
MERGFWNIGTWNGNRKLSAVQKCVELQWGAGCHGHEKSWIHMCVCVWYEFNLTLWG